MNTPQLIGTCFEYAQISELSDRMQTDLDKLLALMKMYKRPDDEIKKLSDIRLLLTEYRYTYTKAGLEKLLKL